MEGSDISLKCEQVCEKLTEFIDNELPSELHEIIQQHLNNCENCLKELESIKKVTHICKKWKDIRPSKNWKADLKRKLLQEQRQSDPEIEMLKSAIIVLSQRIERLEKIQNYIPPTIENEIMTVSELARYLRISKEQVYEIIDHIPKFQIGYEYRFVKESIDQWIRSLEQNEYPQYYVWNDLSEENNEE